MNDLISRQAVFDELKGLYITQPKIKNDYVWDSAIDSATDKIRDLPSVDAVEVVRCKDCKHFKHGNIRPNFCEVFDWSNEKSDFCSFGERKTDG